MISQIENSTIADQILEIKSVYRVGKRKIQPAWSNEINWYAGVERLSDAEKGKLSYYVNVGLRGAQSRENTTITLEDGLIIDLSNKVDKINWEWIKHLPCLALSFEEAQQSKAEFYIHVSGKEAQISNDKTELQFEALSKVMSDSSDNYVDRVLLLGLDMEGEPASEIKKYLLDQAKRNPAKVMSVYRDKRMKINLLFAKAKKAGVVGYNGVDGVYTYGTHILGTTAEMCIAFLQQNDDIMMLIEREIQPEYFQQKQDLAASKKAAEVTSKNTTMADRAKAAREAKK